MNVYLIYNNKGEVVQLVATEEQAKAIMAQPSDGSVYYYERHCVVV